MARKTQFSLASLAVLALVVLCIVLWGQTFAEEGGGDPPPKTEPGTDNGSNVTEPEKKKESENEDECELEQKAHHEDKPGECATEAVADAMGVPRGASKAGDGEAPNPEPGEKGHTPGSTPGESSENPATTGSPNSSGGANEETKPDPQGNGGNGAKQPVPNEDGETKKPGSAGGTGDSGKGGEGDGKDDTPGGKVDGGTNQHCRSASAKGQTPGGTNQKPAGGSVGANPGFLNAPVVFSYRSIDLMGGRLGIGFDANIYDRLVTTPSLNPAAAVAWYPGNGSVHYFTGQLGAGNLVPESAIQDTHSLAEDLSSQQYRYILSDKYGHRRLYDHLGRITRRIDRHGNLNDYIYSVTNGSLVNVTSSYGHPNLWTLKYHPTGRLKTAQDYSGRETEFSYNTSGHLTKVAFPATDTHPTGKKYLIGYWQGTGNSNVDGKIKEIVGPTGVRQVEWDYDAQGLVSTVRRGNGMSQMTISGVGPTRDVVDFNGNLRRYTFPPGLHYPSRVELFTSGLRPDDPPSYVWEYQHNAQRQITSATMPGGKQYEYTYDSKFNLTRRRVISANDPNDYADTTWTYDASNLATSATDAMGNTWNYSRNASGSVASVSSPAAGGGPAVWQYTYNAQGQVETSTNPEGRKTTFLRHTAGPFKGWLLSATVTQTGSGEPGTCGSGQTWQFTHNTRGFATQIVDPAGTTVNIDRDQVDRVTASHANGAVPLRKEIGYNQWGLAESVSTEYRHPDGSLDGAMPAVSSTVTYDDRKRVVQVERDHSDIDVATWTFERDGLGNVTKTVGPEGRERRLSYDERGMVLEVAIGVSQQITSSISFHPDGAMKKVENSTGQSTTTEVDGFGRVAALSLANGARFEKTVDANGRLASGEAKDAQGNVLARYDGSYDARNRLTAVSVSRFGHGGAQETLTTQYEYTPLSRLKKITSPLGRSYSGTYYSCGRPKSATDDQTGGTSEFIYDDRGLLLERNRVESEGGTTKTYQIKYEHDSLGRVVRSIEVDADDTTHEIVHEFLHDSLGRVREVLGPDGVSVKREYNHQSQLIRVDAIENVPGSSPVTHSTAYEWSKDGLMLASIDATGSRTEYEYDERGLLTTHRDPSNATTLLTHDSAGRVTSRTDANGTVTTFNYGATGLHTGTSIQRAAGVLGTTFESYAFDSLGRVVQEIDDDSVVELVRDSVGQILQDRQGPTVQGLWTVQHAYDGEGHRTGLTYPSGMIAAMTRDSAGRLGGVQVGGFSVLSRSHIHTMLLANQTLLGGATRDSWTYDGLYRKVQIALQKLAGGTSTLSDLEYGYSDSHSRLYERRLHAGNTGPLYFYDGLNRLVKSLRGVADPKLELASPGSQAYATRVDYLMDSVGARAQVTTTPFGGAATTVSYLTNTSHEYTAVGGVARAYDANGNLVSDGTRSFAYDYKDRLVEVRTLSGGALVASYEYDVQGRRITKVTPAHSERYFYDGVNLIEVQTLGGVTTHQFVYGEGVDDVGAAYVLDSADIDQDGNTTEFLWFGYHKDAIGSVRTITDLGGAIVETYEYDEYGRMTIRDPVGVVIAASRIGNTFTFTGREYDFETSLFFLRARHYDPHTGSFLQRDPLGPVDGHNLYLYAHASPFTFVDPFGLDDNGGWSLGDFVSALWEAKSAAPALLEYGAKSIAADVKKFAVKKATAVGTTIDALGPTNDDWSTEKALGGLMYGFVDGALETASSLLYPEHGVDLLPDSPFDDKYFGAAAETGQMIETVAECYASVKMAKAMGLCDDAAVAGEVASGAVDDAARAAGGTTSAASESASAKNVWPGSASEMDDLLGMAGKRVPDGPTTAGRDKTIWRPNQHTKITHEQHPYHPTAPVAHKGPHWHLDTPTRRHVRYLKGDSIPGMIP